MCKYSGTPFPYIGPLSRIQGKADHLMLDELELVEKYIDELLLKRGIRLKEE